jgi:hypothetical protein
MNRTPEWSLALKEAMGCQFPTKEDDRVVFSAELEGSFSTTNRSPFSSQAQGVSRSLRELNSFLLSHLDDYVNVNRAIPSKASSMLDDERDLFDCEIAAFLNGCAKSIEGLKVIKEQGEAVSLCSRSGDAEAAVMNESMRMHQEACISLLYDGLKSASAIAEAMQAERHLCVTLESELFVVLPDERGATKRTVQAEEAHIPPDGHDLSAEEQAEDEHIQAAYSIQLRWSNTRNTTATTSTNSSARRPLNSSLVLPASNEGVEDADLAAVTCLERAFEGENRGLLMRLKDELDDARQVETKMAEISGLMNLFAGKVLEQQGEMQSVYDLTTSANERLKQGGKHLDAATQRSSSFRKLYVAFMMTMSILLLFLHHYKT